MREGREGLSGLARLHRIGDADELRAAFRQGFATLATMAGDLVPAPLEGLDPEGLRESATLALQHGLLNDLDWLSDAHATGALYELAAALPPCDVKRDIGKRILTRLHDGTAHTFVVLATQLASSSRRALAGTGIRARIALALELPLSTGIPVDSLALALIARRDLADEWLLGPSTGALPARRLAARLLERAAREAARRALSGDESALAVFEKAQVQSAWVHLLTDREPLVWRHVAIARGLLSSVVPRLDAEVADHLASDLSPTEWRRAAASLAATISFEPERALERVTDVLASSIAHRDRGLGSAFLLGAARASESEPEAVATLVRMVLKNGGLDAIEGVASLLGEGVPEEVGDVASTLALSRLHDADVEGSFGADDGYDALRRCLLQDLAPPEARPPSESAAREYIEAAQLAFQDEGVPQAFQHAVAALHELFGVYQRLEMAHGDDRESRMLSFEALRELDAYFFESTALSDLAALGAAGRSSEHESARQAAAEVSAQIVSGLSEHLLRAESKPILGPDDLAHPTLRIRRLRTLLHVVDAEAAYAESASPEVRDRRRRIAMTLLARARDDKRSPVHRIVHAAGARACEAILRSDPNDLSDIFLVVVNHLRTDGDLVTFSEACMMPETTMLFRAYAELVERLEARERLPAVRIRTGLDAVRILVRHLPAAGGPRVDALRSALLRFAAALEEIAGASSLRELLGELDDRGSRFTTLAEAADAIARLAAGAHHRLSATQPDELPAVGPALHVLEMGALRAARGDRATYRESLEGVFETLRDELPYHLGELAVVALGMTLSFPREAPISKKNAGPATLARREAGLPPWLPPSRTLGGFYVLRALGSGAVGSVFIARRSEERANERAPKFALKVPEFGGTAARTLSESEFLELFREEAGALLAVPSHANLAKLVTFDAGARPKPILVMELVEGQTVERVLRTGGLDHRRAMRTLIGVADGLRAMHDVGVGHLDLKPSNVILCDPDGDGPMDERAVLVDFGLAGRKVRPGCATANYGAPEVWGLMPKGLTPSPAAADIYAFGCLVYEVLTGRELFQGTSDLAIVTAHLQYDGDAPGIETFAVDAALRPVADLLRSMLRQDPRKRIDIRTARTKLAELKLPPKWPLAA